MTDLLTAIGNFITGSHTGTGDYDGILDILGDVTTALLSNPIFQIIMAIAFVSIAFALVMKLVSKIRGRKKK